MISRSSTLALAFACIATFSLAVAAKAQRAEMGAPVRASSMVVIDLPRVVVTGQVARNIAP